MKGTTRQLVDKQNNTMLERMKFFQKIIISFSLRLRCVNESELGTLYRVYILEKVSKINLKYLVFQPKKREGSLLLLTY